MSRCWIRCVHFLMMDGLAIVTAVVAAEPQRPNVLLAISDDQSWPHASAYGSPMVTTPSFDRIAREGVLFTRAFCASPGCSPSRAALLTGLNTWQLEHAGTHASWFSPRFPTWPDRLQEAGYFVGYTGKGWGPGDYRALGRTDNPAGPEFPTAQDHNYPAAFRRFLRERPANQPFCFWFGSHDPHRSYELGSGIAHGKNLDSAVVPSFLPDVPEVRSDLLDYALEIERFDGHLGEMLGMLEQEGQLDNTLIIVTSDNGMPFPRAKANCYEYGVHVPLAIRWKAGGRSGRTVNDLVGFTDLAATIYEATGVAPPDSLPLTGKSLLAILQSDTEGIVDPSRSAVYVARERHSSSRFNSLGYPQRAVRTPQYLYIRNLKPERWPAGPALRYDEVTYDQVGRVLNYTMADPLQAYHDIDGSPTLEYLITHQRNPRVLSSLEWAVDRHPAEELYDVEKDPACLVNLAEESGWHAVRAELALLLDNYLRETGDARIMGDGDVWETYPRVSKLRWFPEPEWARKSPSSIPAQPWLEAQRPR